MKMKVIFGVLALTLGATACSTSSHKGEASNAEVQKATRAIASANSVDDNCFVDYSHAAGECNSESGNNDAAFSACLAPVKAKLRSCCQQRGATADCAADARDTESNTTATTQNVDDNCFVQYSHAAGSCNGQFPTNQKRFRACLAPVKAELRACCRDNHGSPSCDGDAR